LRVGDLALDQQARIGRRGSRIIPLTFVEFELLRMLLLTPGRAVSREEIFRSVLGRDYSPFDRSIDNHVGALRRKLGKGAKGLDRIQPVRNVGYVYIWLDD
jgi:DNA-binding response OmpR family regulator